MVEMLGVLSIISVISISGILGYKYAMNKYRANQIVAELNLTVNQLEMIMARPHEEDYSLTLSEPYDNNKLPLGDFEFYYGCGVDTVSVDACAPKETRYFEVLSNVSKSICQSLVPAVKYLPNLVLQQVNDVVDMTGTNCTLEKNKITLFFEDTKTTNVDCPRLRPQYNETTKECEICPTGTPLWNNETEKYEPCPAGFEWRAEKNTCVSDDANKKCFSNDNCKRGEYCWIKSSSCAKENIKESYCKEAKKVDKEHGFVWHMSVEVMSWWNAKRFCQAIGYPTMLSTGDLECKNATIGMGEKDSIGYCYDKYNTIEDVKSPVIDNLQKAYGNKVVWLSNDYGNSCGSYHMRFHNGSVEYGNKHSDYSSNHAVCC